MDALPETPHKAFGLWLDEAIAAGVQEPHAMTLSTVDAEGRPDARVLILKNVDDRGWHFAVKAQSPKGEQIAANRDVALTFYWPKLGRQVRLRGKAVELSREECAEDFLARPVGSKLSAIASLQSQVLESPDDIDRRLSEARAILAGEPDYVAATWTVFAVAPTVVEFWQGATDRLHKRLRYARSDTGQWHRSRLWP